MKIKNKTVDEVVEKLAFDGIEEDVNNSIKYYYFCCDDLEEAKDVSFSSKTKCKTFYIFY